MADRVKTAPSAHCPAQGRFQFRRIIRMKEIRDEFALAERSANEAINIACIGVGLTSAVEMSAIASPAAAPPTSHATVQA